MPSKTTRFLGGMLGAALPYAVFYARHGEVLQDVRGAHGTTGLAVAGAAGAGVAVVGGILALVVAPARWGVAVLLGVLVTAGVFVAGIPQFGKATEGARPKAEPAWLAVTPVSVAVGHAVRSAQGAAQADRDAAVNTARDSAASDLKIASEKAQADQVAAVAAEGTRLREEHAGALASARSAAEKAQRDAVAAARSAAADEGERMLAEAKAAADDERDKLMAKIEALAAVAEERDSLRSALAELERALSVERTGRASADQDLADLRQLSQWTEADNKAGKPMLRVLTAKMGSKEAGDRVIAARLLPLVGNGAIPLLTKAVNDPDAAVAAAAKASLAKLSG